MDPIALLKIAAAAQNNAYAPYSHFHVGAALLAENGEIFTGCNVENASYGLSNCAERSAVFRAVSEGVKNFTAIAIAMPKTGSPCGACRQVLSEFNPQLKVFIGDATGQLVKETRIDTLLPDAFGPQNLTE